MIARLFYVLITISGLLLFMKYGSNNAALYGIELLGIITIGLMEMVLVRSTKGKKVSTLAILLFISLIATMFLGFKLPIGIDWFA